MRHLALACACASLALAGGVIAQPDNRKGVGAEGKVADRAKVKPGGNSNNRRANARRDRPVNDAIRGIPGRDNAGGKRNTDTVRPDLRRPARRTLVDHADNEVGDFARSRDVRLFGLMEGCPPGLARKRNGCMPPGLARKRNYNPTLFGYRDVEAGRYLFDDGYLLRVGQNGGIASYIPLLGGALAIGNIWPNDYRRTQLPEYYETYWSLGGRDSYRYADNVLYRVDPETDAITSVAALLTGDKFQVGSRMPAGYDVYNVPVGVRDKYRDGPSGNYRYSDGYIYRVDPDTRLVAAAIEMVV